MRKHDDGDAFVEKCESLRISHTYAYAEICDFRIYQNVWKMCDMQIFTKILRYMLQSHNHCKLTLLYVSLIWNIAVHRTNTVCYYCFSKRDRSSAKCTGSCAFWGRSKWDCTWLGACWAGAMYDTVPPASIQFRSDCWQWLSVLCVLCVLQWCDYWYPW